MGDARGGGAKKDGDGARRCRGCGQSIEYSAHAWRPYKHSPLQTRSLSTRTLLPGSAPSKVDAHVSPALSAEGSAAAAGSGNGPCRPGQSGAGSSVVAGEQLGGCGPRLGGCGSAVINGGLLSPDAGLQRRSGPSSSDLAG